MSFKWTGECKVFGNFRRKSCLIFAFQILPTKDVVFLFNAARDEKKPKYNDAAEARRATFTPVIATYDGIFDHEAISYMKRLSTLLSSKWNQNYSQVHGWLKARMQVCILRSVSLCIRGSRTRFRGAGIEHGAQISLFSGWRFFLFFLIWLMHIWAYVLINVSVFLSFNVKRRIINNCKFYITWNIPW